MTIMKTKALFIILLPLLFAYKTGISQVPPDSIIGYYIGDLWFRYDDDPWTITTDTIQVLNIDTNGCWVHYVAFNGAVWTRHYFSDYGYCSVGNPGNFSITFHSGDSVTEINDNFTPPPPVQYQSERFYGKKAYINISVSENEREKLVKAYPNPAKDKLILSASYKGKEIEAELLSIQGKKMWAGVIQQKTIVDVSSFPKGVYFLKVNNRKRVFIKKIIKI